jgi:hypothetical protein
MSNMRELSRPISAIGGRGCCDAQRDFRSTTWWCSLTLKDLRAAINHPRRDGHIDASLPKDALGMKVVGIGEELCLWTSLKSLSVKNASAITATVSILRL